MKIKHPKDKGIRFFKCLKEIKWYFAYRKLVETYSNTDTWQRFACRYSISRRFGFIVKIYTQYIYADEAEMFPGEKEKLARSYIADYITPFTNGLDRLGLYQNYVTIQIQQRLGEIETKLLDEFLFYEVQFAYNWAYLKKSYIFSRFFLLIVCGAICFNFNEIIQYFKTLI